VPTYAALCVIYNKCLTVSSTILNFLDSLPICHAQLRRLKHIKMQFNSVVALIFGLTHLTTVGACYCNTVIHHEPCRLQSYCLGYVPGGLRKTAESNVCLHGRSRCQHGFDQLDGGPVLQRHHFVVHLLPVRFHDRPVTVGNVHQLMEY